METKTTQATGTHWPSLIILAILIIGMLFFLGTSLVMSLVSLISLIEGKAAAADTMIMAFSTGIEFILLCGSIWFVLQKSRNSETAQTSVKFPFAPWQLIVIPLLVLIAISLGAAVAIYANKYLNWFILPMTTLLVIGLPIFLYIGLGTRGIEAGPRWHAWGTVGLGLTIGPFLMITIEVLIVLIPAIIFLLLHPEKLSEIQSLITLLDQQTNEDAMLRLLAPYLSDTRVMIAVFGYIAGIVPLIEEMLKPLAVWLLGRSIAKPSHGFVLGMLSGGAFALVESLNAGAESSEAWPFAVGVRAGTSLLHIVLTGIMGYAIVGAFRERKFGRLAAAYLAVAAIHGLWNACAVAVGFSASGETFGKPEWFVFLPASLAGILVIGAGILAILLAANRKVRSELAPAPVLTPVMDQE